MNCVNSPRDELFEELKKDVAARGGAKQQTDVMALNADLLEVATEADKHWASVRFSGTLRESPGDAPQGFEEVWNLAKPVSGPGGWQLAGIQQMHNLPVWLHEKATSRWPFSSFDP